jgi:hypothetical protein
MLIAAVRASPSAGVSAEAAMLVGYQALPAPEYDGQSHPLCSGAVGLPRWNLTLFGSWRLRDILVC